MQAHRFSKRGKFDDSLVKQTPMEAFLPTAVARIVEEYAWPFPEELSESESHGLLMLCAAAGNSAAHLAEICGSFVDLQQKPHILSVASALFAGPFGEPSPYWMSSLYADLGSRGYPLSPGSARHVVRTYTAPHLVCEKADGGFAYLYSGTRVRQLVSWTCLQVFEWCGTDEAQLACLLQSSRALEHALNLAPTACLDDGMPRLGCCCIFLALALACLCALAANVASVRYSTISF